MKRRDFVRACGGGAAAVAMQRSALAAATRDARPNILFAFADDWVWPHASVAGDPVIKTPTFDRVAREGVMFTRAYVSAPSCTPSRGAILTGQYHWRLEEGANLWSTLPAKFQVYPDLLEQAGYHVGFCRKGWGPGSDTAGGRTRNPAGPRHKSFEAFLEARPAGRPFCFWFGSTDPHRGYTWRSGVESGMKLQDVRVPACLPDHEIVRTDLCDYYWEVQRYDRETGEMLKLLEAKGELDNTIVVMSGDNGLPFPRCKSNLYDLGTNAPLGIRWPAKVKGGRVVEDFVSLCDLAPTFLEAAGLKPPAAMTGRSLMTILASGKSGRVDPTRDHVLTGMERHTCAQAGTTEGYPMRAIHARDYLYIRNFKPERWPAGTPEAYRDIDGSPTKKYMMDNRDDPKVKPLFDLAFGKRPAEELYDRRKDPGLLKNVAADPAYADTRKQLADALMAELKATADPRALGQGDVFDQYRYGGGGTPPKKAKK